MNCIVIDYDQAKLEGSPKAIPTGQSEFSKIKFKFSEEWTGMTKIAQFAQEKSRYNVSVENDECHCPVELTKGWVFVRVRGYSESSTIATANEIKLPVVNGFVPGGSPSVPPEPDLYQKLIEETKGQIGNLNDLETEDKSSLVGAVNEVKKKAETGGDAVKYTEQELTSAQQEQARTNISAGLPPYIVTVSKDEDGNYSWDGNMYTMTDIAQIFYTGRRVSLFIDDTDLAKYELTLISVKLDGLQRYATRLTFAVAYPDNTANECVADNIVITYDTGRVKVSKEQVRIDKRVIDSLEANMLVPISLEQGAFGYWYINGNSAFGEISANPKKHAIVYVPSKYGDLPLYLSSISDTEIIYKNISSDGSWVGFKVGANSSPQDCGVISGAATGAKNVFTTIESVDDGNGNLTYTSSKTFEELLAAFDAGAMLFALYMGMIIPINMGDASSIVFSQPSMFDGPDLEIIISADNTVRVMEIPKSKGIMMALRNDGNVGTEVSSTSTNDELATAKAVYDAITAAIGNIDTLVGTGEVTT